jgi:hypothetical protein
VHPAGAVLDEHQDVQPFQQHGVDVQEVDGEDPGGLRVPAAGGCANQPRNRVFERHTVPPSPQGYGMYSCLPEHMIANYNQCVRWTRRTSQGASAYLFWGAEYWLLRARQAMPRTCARSAVSSTRLAISACAQGS